MKSSLFHESWWLNSAAPGAWREARVEENGQAIARLPFTERRVFGLRLLLAPPLCSRLGPMIDLGEGRLETRLRRFDHLVNELIDQLPPADLFRQVLHPEILSWLPFHRRGFRVEPRISYVLDGITDKDAIWRGISGRTRRVIRNADRKLTVEEDDTPDRLIPMIQATFERQHLNAPYDPAVVRRIVSACLDQGRGTVLSAVDSSGAVHASLFCAWDDHRAWYLGGGGDPALRSSGAGSLLMWELIQRAAKHVDRFDFEGSMLPSVERYFRNFGGRPETCFLVTKVSRRFSPVWALWQRQQQWLASGNERSGRFGRLLFQAAGAIRGAGAARGDDSGTQR